MNLLQLPPIGLDVRGCVFLDLVQRLDRPHRVERAPAHLLLTRVEVRGHGREALLLGSCCIFAIIPFLAINLAVIVILFDYFFDGVGAEKIVHRVVSLVFFGRTTLDLPMFARFI